MKRLLSFLLGFMMLLMMMPSFALAEENTAEEMTEESEALDTETIEESPEAAEMPEESAEEMTENPETVAEQPDEEISEEAAVPEEEVGAEEIVLAEESAATDIIREGVCDTVPWRLTSDYELIIGKTGEEYTFAERSSRTVNSYTWYSDWRYNDQIKSVRFEGTVHGTGSMSYLFYNFKTVTKIDLTNFETSNVTDFSNMFMNCYVLQDLDISDLKTDSAVNMANMFYQCRALTSLDLSNWNTAHVTNMSNMFYDCNVLKSISFGSSFNTSSVTDMACMFWKCNSLEALDVSSFDTSNVTSMFEMFSECYTLSELDLSNFNTGKVTNMRHMFSYCQNLKNLDISSFNTENVTDISIMFNYCEKLTSLDLSHFNTDKVTNMESMFSNCTALEELDISSFRTDNVTKMSSMFSYCKSLKNLDLTRFNTENVTLIDGMFWHCESLETLDLSSFKTPKAKEIDTLFCDCINLRSLNISNFSTESVDWNDRNDYSRVLYNCKSLTDIALGEHITLKECLAPNSGWTRYQMLDGTAVDGPEIANLDDYDAACPGWYHSEPDPCSNGHRWGEWIIKKEATYDEPGEMIRYCLNDESHYETRVIAKLERISITPTIKLSKTTFTYNAKVQKPVVKVYNGSTLLSEQYYEVTFSSGCKNAGTYKVTVELKDPYAGQNTATFKIVKATNTLKVKQIAKTLSTKASTVKKKAVTFKLSKYAKITKSNGTVTYSKTSGNKKITVNAKTGLITVKKGLKKGSYKIKVKITAKGNTNYKSGSKTLTVTIKVK